MESDDQGKSVKETIADEAKGLAAEAYKDVGRPVLAPLGKTAGTAVEVLLAPADIILGGLKAGFDRLKIRLGKKLERVPPERQLPPPATIAAPTALQYALLGEGDEVSDLREMFENLLVTSMDRDTARSAHPAFVSMLAQITQDEAWILKSIVDISDNVFTLVQAREMDEVGISYKERGILCTLGIGIGIDESRQAQYLTNLERLGLLETEWQATAAGTRAHAEYAELERRIRARPDLEGVRLKIHKGLVRVTPLGEQFWNTCVRSRAV